MIRLLGLFLALALPTVSLAQDLIILKGKTKKDGIKGTIKNESPLEINLTSGVKVPSNDVEDVQYGLPEGLPMLITLRLKYDALLNKEIESKDPKDAKRKDKILDALKGYRQIQIDVKDKLLNRHLEYKLAHLQARLALEEGFNADPAIAELKAFIEKYDSSWQFPRAALTLARFQMEKNDVLGAEKTYEKISKAEVAPELKQEAELQTALIGAKTGKHAAALKKLKDLLSSSKLPASHPNMIRAQVAVAECMVKLDQTDAAIGMLQKMIVAAPEKNVAVKAAAHNALGVCYVEKKAWEEARWEFLWVDVVFNQDPGEHAKALYYLNKVFLELKEAERAQQCREMLLNDKTFSGQEYQRKMIAEKLN